MNNYSYEQLFKKIFIMVKNKIELKPLNSNSYSHPPYLQRASALFFFVAIYPKLYSKSTLNYEQLFI